MIDDLSMSSTTKKDVLKAKTFMAFVATHCHIRQYSFQVKKCDDPSCCAPPRLSSEVFSNIHWFPDPSFTSDKAHFKMFEAQEGVHTEQSLLSWMESTGGSPH